jgi:hypothetical protein
MSCYRVLTSAVMSPAYHLKINGFHCKKNTKLGGRGEKVGSPLRLEGRSPVILDFRMQI